MEMNDMTRKAVKGCKVAAVMLWICCGSNIFGAVMMLFSALMISNAAALVTVLVVGGMAFFSGWMAKSINRVVKWIENKDGGENGDQEQIGQEESKIKLKKYDMKDQFFGKIY